MKSITCNTYTIHVNNWQALNQFVSERDYSSIVVIVDENTLQLCLPLFAEKIDFDYTLILTKSGELNKNIESCTDIWNEMIELGADRHSLCINLGGGVIGDMGGFAASTFMRGMDFIQIPTTLLSQVDASVGGKLGIDFQNYKNLIGLIKNPRGVFIFTNFLKTLPYEHLLSGFAEVVKHGLIKNKDSFLKWTQMDSLNHINWEELVFESVNIKKSVAEEDPYEKGIRKILNFGHTLGHAIESLLLSSERQLLHGEAIAIGMVMEAHLSFQKGYLSLDDAVLVKQKVTMLFGHHKAIIPDLDALIEVMSKDKKNKGSAIMFSLLKTIGQGNFNQQVKKEEIQKAISFYQA